MNTVASIIAAGLALGVLAPAAVCGEAQPEPGLAVGEDAPAFELPGSDGKSYRLSELAGERAVVLEPEDRYALRHTIYIGAEGKVLFVDHEVSPRTAGADVAAKLEELGVPKKK